MYVTRSYEAIYNPAFKDKLKSVLQNKKKSAQPKKYMKALKLVVLLLKNNLN